MHELPVVFEEKATTSGQIIAVATLNDPKALNALSLEMIDLLYSQLIQWSRQPEVVCVLLKGAGEKAFCAGGNIRKLYESIIDSKYGENDYAEAFFSREYRLDYLIHKYPKPFICIGHGFVMGGGVGLITGASHRVVTQSTVMAMPEISIGLFPDVGSSWFLSRMPEGLGSFIGMTGVRMKAMDTLFCGLADYLLSDSDAREILSSLQSLPWHNENIEKNRNTLDTFLQTLARHHQMSNPQSEIEGQYKNIRSIMRNATPDTVLARLKSSNNEWLIKSAKNLERGCPATAWIVAEQIKRSKNMTLEDIFKMEFDIAIQCTRFRDFSEGIRALLIDRDNHPKWEDNSLQAVSSEKVNAFFTPCLKDERHPLINISDMLKSSGDC